MNSPYNVHNVIEIFDAKTEKYLESIIIPKERKRQLFELMGWQQPEDEIFSYDGLSMHQLTVIGEWLDRDLTSPLWDIQISGIAK